MEMMSSKLKGKTKAKLTAQDEHAKKSVRNKMAWFSCPLCVGPFL
jgi:hypothetical protein